MRKSEFGVPAPQATEVWRADAASLAVDWNYTDLADSYVRRPGYAPAAIDAFLGLAGPGASRNIVDLGAGTGLLTKLLAERGGPVLALEPNRAMRRHGMAWTGSCPNVRWVVGRMEETGLAAGQFSLATCGSCFGVADHGATLREVGRILEPGGWFACMWNYRDLQDPLQRRIEAFIRTSLPQFDYGSRREDQTPIIGASGLFEDARIVEADILHRVGKAEWVEAWHSHATLMRQAGPRSGKILEGIAAIVDETSGDTIAIPYTTRVWLARLRPAGARGGGTG